MRMLKSSLLIVAFAAMAFSVAPLFGAEQEHQGTGGGGSGSSSWTVTCNYDGNNHLTSKVCTSGGSSSCNCGS